MGAGRGRAQPDPAGAGDTVGAAQFVPTEARSWRAVSSFSDPATSSWHHRLQAALQRSATAPAVTALLC